MRFTAALAAACALLAALAAGAQALPRVSITTQAQIVDDPKVDGRMRIPGRQGVSTRIGIEIRGHSSQLFPKKQYAVEAQTRSGDNRDVGMLGLPPSDDWVLSAPYSDKSLIRNALAYRTARRLGRYAPRTRFVELRLNGNYRGVYVLTEKPKFGDNRLPEADPNDFFVELTFDFQAIGEPHFTGKRSRRPYLFQDPDRDDLSGRQARRVAAAVNRLERALYRRGKRGAARNYDRLLDVPAAVDFVLVQELFKNIDAFHGSTYMHRAEGREIVFGPVWDFDLSMGNHDEPPRGEPTGFTSRHRPLAEQLFRDARFREALRERWSQLRADGFRGRLLRDLAQMRRVLRDGAAARNFARWPILGRYVWPNPVDPATGTYRTSWHSEAKFVRSWLSDRMRWLDRRLR